jgi:aromatic-amino-acid transaminase
MFEHVVAFPGDPILTLNEDFLKDLRADKINLSIGVYLDEAGRLPLMDSVLKAETAILGAPGSRPYLPMEGAPNYRKEVQHLLFGNEHPAVVDSRIATVQTIGGSGALKVGADFLAANFRQSAVWVCDPTWDNHLSIFGRAGFQVFRYPYYDAKTHHVDFKALQASLEKIPAGDIVLLHACCHNPTGADLTEQQWRELAIIIRTRSLLPFFDIAYQGFGSGIDDDAFAIRHFSSEGIACLVASSFSKNLSLYGERCGALHIVCDTAGQARNVLGQLKGTVRCNYSSPPTHGSRIVTMVLESSALRAEWERDLNKMRARLVTMREGLHAALHSRRPDVDFSYLLQQKGMFSFTGLTPVQIRRLREEFGIYLIESGRICIAALTQKAIQPLADAMAQIIER